ncbi:uncharacterized protein [Haliotis cracherodii]|uniref:uncharacterized protein n=1 Tax=Haliotis cracherodii TaxID=6455 RepID=UPI0039EB48BA
MCSIHMYLVAAAVCFIGSVHSSRTKFQCPDSRCFSSTFLCDGIPDCDDQSDEKNCAGCDSNMFKCQNSNCIRALFACDGNDDCGDGSDELICGTCMFGCQDSRLVPADEVCDGFDDCRDGSDELNCGASTEKEAPSSTSTETATPSTASSTSTETATPSTASSTSTATATPSTAYTTVDQLSVIVEGQCNQTDGTYIHDKTTVAVHCDFRSNTFANLSISCSRKGTEMSKSDRISYETGRQRRNPGLFYVQFQFTPVLRRDRGNYSCKATAGQSSKAIAVSLLVYKVPAVTLSPSTLSLQEGDQRNFTCQVNNAPAVKTVPRSLVWCQSDQVVTDQSKIVRVRDGMEILMMNSSDRAGVYKCGVINCTETATLVITKPEVIVEGQCNQTDGTYIHGKTTVAVHCDFRSNTFANLSVSCLRKGTEMSKSDRISYETGRQRRNPGLFYAQFQFTPVLRRDRGNYSCKATSGQSSKAIAVTLLVYEVPTVTLSPSTLSLQEGDQRNFTCQVNNAPAVKTVPGSLVWCQSDQVVTDQSKIVRVRDGMEILMMNSSDRAGVYKCGVINCTETATLVITKPEVIVEGQCNQTDGTYIHGKTTVAVHCDFRSNTFANLSVSCLRKGTEMSKSDRISYETGRQRRNPGLFYAQFQFTPVLRRDRGNYSCKATSGQSSKAIAVSLLVYEVPTVTLSPSTLSLQEGDQRNFTCQVNNAPAVKTVPGSLVWCQSDQVVTDQSKIVRVRDGMEILMMNSSDRAGVYKCGVINCTETATLVITKPEDKACTETTDTRGTVWPQTVSNTTMVLPCPGGFLGKVHRVCDVTGEWGESNYINCVREEIAQIEEEVAAITEGTASSEAVKNVLENLQKATENNDSSAGDLDKSIDIVDNIVAAVSGPASSVAVDTASVKSFVNVIDNILSVDTSKQDWQQVQKKNPTKAASLARSVTAFGLAAAESQTENEPLKLNSSTMVMEIAKVTGRDIAFPSQGMEEVKSSLRLSKENFNHTAKITYVAASYKTMAEFLLTNTSGEETSTKEVNSQILSLAVNIGGKKLSNLKMKIYLDFHHLQGNYSESECGYWDFDKSRWLTDGCTGKDVNSSYTSCECNHLTNFAILMSPGRHVSAKHLHHLKIISIVGCSLSIIGCVVTVLTHVCLWSYVRSSKSIILMNLCVALTCAYSVFLAGVERTENKAACTAVAAMLHYFFLAVFSLMLAQGVDIAVQVAVVFRKSSRLGLVLPLAWGVPAVIVGITLGVTRLEGYGNDQFCWLTVTDGILFAFVGPALFVVLANAVIIAIIFRVLCSTRMMVNKGNKEKIVTTVRSLCVLMPVLGVTWVFGVLAINEETVIFQYLFAVFNSLQGFLIFIMHCGLNRTIIQGIRETIARYESQITMSKSLPYSRNTDQSEERRAAKEKTCTDIPTSCNSDDLVSPTMEEMSTLFNVEASQKSVSTNDANPSSLIKEG